jgi:hypothetical protein
MDHLWESKLARKTYSSIMTIQTILSQEADATLAAAPMAHHPLVLCELVFATESDIAIRLWAAENAWDVIDSLPFFFLHPQVCRGDASGLGGHNRVGEMKWLAAQEQFELVLGLLFRKRSSVLSVRTQESVVKVNEREQSRSVHRKTGVLRVWW